MVRSPGEVGVLCIAQRIVGVLSACKVRLVLLFDVVGKLLLPFRKTVTRVIVLVVIHTASLSGGTSCRTHAEPVEA